MRAKYFLKGMGIGVTVTALIFMISLAFNPPTLSDEEVIGRAKVLGMVESDEMEEEQTAMEEEASDATEDTEAVEDDSTKETTDADTSEADEVSDEEAMKALRKLMDEQEAAEVADEETTEAEAADNTAYKSTDTVSDSSESAETPKSTISFTVHQGEDSSTVAARLYRAGIVDDPTALDTYLSTNGYDTRIHPGTYNIPAGSSYAAIANAIAY